MLNTAAGIGECVGQSQVGVFPNDLYTIGAELTLQDGSSVSVTRAEPLFFGNANIIDVVPDDIGPRVVGTGGDVWWGGPRDLSWFACPIVFDDSITNLGGVCEIVLSADGDPSGLEDAPSAGGTTGALSLNGDGNGELSLSTEPFSYTAFYRDSDGDPDNEDRVEDIPFGDQHVIGVGASGAQVFACDGTNVSGDFTVFSDFRNIDTTAPMCDQTNGGVGDGECEPVIDGADMFVLQNGLYSDGTIVLDDVADGGVGIASVIIDAFDFADGGAANQTLFLADVGDVADLPEDDGCGSGLSTDITTQLGCAGVEAGVPVDAYFIFISEVEDLLENALGDSPDGLDLDILDYFDNSEEFGLDFTEPDITDVEPPSETPLFVWNPDLGFDGLADGTRTCPSLDAVADCESIMWESVDPDLASGDDPSGVEDGSCGATCLDDDANAHVGAGDGNLIEAEIDDSPGDLQDGETLAASNAGLGADMFEAFFCAGGGVGAECDGDDDGTYTVDIFSSDKAVKVNNVNVTPTTFILDTNPPVIGFGGITGLNASNAATVEFVLDASVVDRNGDGTGLTLVEVQVSLETAAENGVCGSGDEFLTEDEVLVTPNEDTTGATVMVDVTSQVNTNGGQFQVTFTAANQVGNTDLSPTPVSGDVFQYCFAITADDGATTKDGTADGTDISSDAGKNFTWQ